MFYKKEKLSKVYFIVSLVFLLGLFSCKGDGGKTSSLPDLDLMKYGMPIKIKAPAGAEVKASDMGIMKDVTIKGENNFFLQVTSGIATTTNAADIKAQQLSEVKAAMFFDALLEEDESGFIYKKKITETRENHDFRVVKIQGDQEYIFQTGLSGQYSLEDVQRMYASVKS